MKPDLRPPFALILILLMGLGFVIYDTLREKVTQVGDTAPDFEVTAHTGQPARAQRCVLDEHGRVYLDTELGFGLVHTQDMLMAADAIEQGLWVPQEVLAHDLPERFAYVRSPEAAHK